MSYPGGKDGSGVWQRIVNELPPHEVFISAFLGDCAVLRRKKPAAWNIGIDVDDSVVRRFAGSASLELERVLDLYVDDAVSWLRRAFDLDRLGSYWRGMDACGRFGVGPEKIVVYVDPPYLASSRKSERRVYRYELGEVEHTALLRCLKDLPVLVVVHHYPCEMYDEALSGWRSFEYAAMTRGGLATEKVWLNFGKAKVLHDVRWLGADKRVREKLTRRRKNLMRRLRSLPEEERQSILSELVG